MRMMDQEFKETLTAFFKRTTPDETVVFFDQLQGDGSIRVFWRMKGLTSARSFIAMANPPVTEALDRENRAYLAIARHLGQKKIPLPAIHQYDLGRGWFIMEDLGQTNLQDLVLSGKDPVPVYCKILEHLLRMQVQGGEGFDPTWCCQTERYDRTVMQQHEAHYFRDAFLKGFLGYDPSWPDLEVAFDHLADRASRAEAGFFIHRDFQSRNIMVMDQKIGIIDWQGGRFGPLAYDVASLLVDPYVRLSEHQKREIYSAYVDLVKNRNPAWTEPFKRDYPYLAIQRNLQILGAFAFLSKVMKKPHFEVHIPHAVKSLEALLEEAADHGLNPLKQLVSEINRSHHLWTGTGGSSNGGKKETF